MINTLIVVGFFAFFFSGFFLNYLGPLISLIWIAMVGYGGAAIAVFLIPVGMLYSETFAVYLFIAIYFVEIVSSTVFVIRIKNEETIKRL